MDIDVLEIQSSYHTQSISKKQITAPVDDAHPFDLDSYISAYSGQFLYSPILYYCHFTT